MTCQEFWNHMPERRGPHSPAASDHIRECARCAALLERHDELAAGLRRAAAGWGADGAPARVESRLLSAYGGYTGLGATRPQRIWIPLATWVGAAAALAVMAVFLIHDRQPPQTHRTVAAIELAADSSEMGDGFIPLPTAAHLNGSEEIDLVRVEISRSALMAMGVSLDGEAAESVQAEFQVGSDGFARAVRVVSE
jgi:hypothetical protein